jgi:hypothetical protein
LNPIATTFIAKAIDVVKTKLEENMFGGGRGSIEESSQALVIGNLLLFRRLCISSFACANPLAWWRMHDGQL